MKTFAYIPVGRSFWFDLAVTLHLENIASPVMWMGDPRLDRRAAEAFPHCKVLPANQMRSGTLEDPEPYSGEFAGFWTSENYARAKDHSVKLLDRIDWMGTHRNVTREVFVNALVASGLAAVKRADPDFLLMAESPHAPASYVLYEIFRYLKRDIYSFCSFIYAPGLLLKKGGVDGVALPLPKAAKSPLFGEIAKAEVTNWVSRLTSKDPATFDPTYMRAQWAAEARRRRFNRITSMMLAPVRLLLAPIRKAISSRYSLDLEPRDQTRNFFREDKMPPRSTLNLRKTIQERLRRLSDAIAKEVDSALPQRFVYYPLHYEPERTSNPDGGIFHDQFKCLAVLRSMLPDDVWICVKEHPSQLMATRRGFMGRSPGFYHAIKGISNLQIVPLDTPSRDLIDRCLFVATLTGSAALEAAFLKKRGLLFGSTWFETCPNTHLFKDGVDFETLTSPTTADGEAVKRWLVDRARHYCVPGCVNPSNERSLKRFYEIEGFREAELKASVEALRGALEG